ncbi:LpxI family protein [Ahrensia kielensis]|uniref:LpxI family protein n=1 Tax=Ahrensia kielensis TaxID=76980 RepID=UPI00037680E7|nr:UDP-2,3-diacylglucosamine diphosphatase LpxI [Ahrensia kielensis]
MTGRDTKISDLNGDANAGGRIAIIAGGGKVPVQIAHYLRKNQQEPFIIMLAGEADPALYAFEHEEISVAAIGKLVCVLKEQQIKRVVIIGSVRRRPKITDLRPDLSTLKFLGRFVSGLVSGDNELLSKIVETIEEIGVKVVGAHDVMPQLLAPMGKIAGSMPTASQRGSIARGIEAALALGVIDAGQCCVVIGRNIIALEGVEGTDAMLQRVADQKQHGRLTNTRGGVLVKMCKPQQDKRVDLPTIGQSTIENAALAMLDGIAVHGDNAMIVDVEDVIKQADAADMFIIGIDGTYGSSQND